MKNKKEIKTWYVVSDIHGDYFDLYVALRRAGYKKTDPTKGLIVVGDIFDRFNENIRVYKFLSSIPKSRCILIRGNHEYLFRDLLNKRYPEIHDFSNHTVDTFCEIAHRDISDFHNGDVSWKEITDYVKSSKVWTWLNSSQWRDYFELGPYIFTHSFIPVKVKEQYKPRYLMYGAYDMSAKCFEYDPNWREASQKDLEESTWGDPIDYYKAGLFDEEARKGKILVVGHWHVSDFYKRLANIYSYDEPITEIYFSEHLIGLDCGVYRRGVYGYWHPQNVLVIDTETWKCYDKSGNELKPIKPARIIETVTVGDKNE